MTDRDAAITRAMHDASRAFHDNSKNQSTCLAYRSEHGYNRFCPCADNWRSFLKLTPKPPITKGAPMVTRKKAITKK